MNKITRNILLGFVFALAACVATPALATPLSAARATASKGVGLVKSYKMKASTTIYAGGMVMIDSNGLALPAAASASNHGVVGVAVETKTSASSGTYKIKVQEGWFLFVGTTLGQEDVGNPVYAEDDQTIDDAAGANEPIAGFLIEYVSATSGWVVISPTLTSRFTVSTDPTTMTGDLTLGGGAGAATFSDSASSVVVPDNDTTALLIGSTGQLGLITIDTGDSAETVQLNGTTATTTLHVNVGEALFDEGVDMAVASTHLGVMRFCCNGPDGSTTTYCSPVADKFVTNYEFGGSGCDGEDSTTESTADEVYHAGYAIKPVAMAAVGLCTGATAANDAIVFQLRDDTASVTGMTCTTAALGGDAVPAQCTVRDPSPATIAAGSTVALAITMTNDDCNDAGDDFEAHVYFTY